MLRFKHTGNFKKTEQFLMNGSAGRYLDALIKFGDEGVAALASATPVDSGETSKSWGYEIVRTDKGVSIFWTNSNENKGVNIAIILQYGHGTRNGGFVQGIDYINPAIRPVFEKIANDAWREVTAL